jgi:CBS domain-containing protein
MIRGARFIDPEVTLEQAARVMTEIKADALPVGENDRPVGIITDRDIAIHCVVQGHPSDTKIGDVMSPAFFCCFDDDDTETVLGKMAETRLRCVPVLNREKRLVGMISISDLARARTRGSTIFG